MCALLLGKYVNIEKHAAKRKKRMYHGSSAKFDSFEPKSHALADGDRVVFGTPLRAMAVAGMGRWTDNDFDQGTYNDEELLHMRELKPGALERIYKGKRGYLYELDPESFEHGGERYMPTEFISKSSPKILKRTEVDAYEAMLAEERAGRLKIHRMQKKAAKRKKAVIIKGNPYYLEQGPDTAGYAAYYKDIENELRSAGYDDVVYDRGEPMTLPPPADLWVGHSRGASRLRFAPKGTKTLNITEYEDGINEYKAKILKEMRKRGYSSVAEFPVEERPRPGREHFTLTQRGRDALRKQASAPRDYKREYRLFHSSPEAKRNRAKRNLWNRRLKGKVPAGHEIDHKRQLRDGGGNGRDNIRFMRVSKNRSEHNRSKAVKDHMRKESSIGAGAGVGALGLGSIAALEAPKGKKLEHAAKGALLGGLLGGGIGAAHKALPGVAAKAEESLVKASSYPTKRRKIEVDREKVRDHITGTRKNVGTVLGGGLGLLAGSKGGLGAMALASGVGSGLGYFASKALRTKDSEVEAFINENNLDNRRDRDYTDAEMAALSAGGGIADLSARERMRKRFAKTAAKRRKMTHVDPDKYNNSFRLGRSVGGGMAGGMLGGTLGALSGRPVYGAIGAGLGAGLGYATYSPYSDEEVYQRTRRTRRDLVKANLRARLEDVHPDILNADNETFLNEEDIRKEASVAVKRDPAKWEAAKREAKAKMGGKHSARAMQLATQIYKKRGGTYAGKKPSSSNNKLRKWTKQKWQWSGGDKPGQGGRGVYLPKRSKEQLSSNKAGRAKLRAAARVKQRATARGQQFASHGLHVGKRRSDTA